MHVSSCSLRFELQRRGAAASSSCTPSWPCHAPGSSLMQETGLDPYKEQRIKLCLVFLPPAPNSSRHMLLVFRAGGCAGPVQAAAHQALPRAPLSCTQLFTSCVLESHAGGCAGPVQAAAHQAGRACGAPRDHPQVCEQTAGVERWCKQDAVVCMCKWMCSRRWCKQTVGVCMRELMYG